MRIAFVIMHVAYGLCCFLFFFDFVLQKYGNNEVFSLCQECRNVYAPPQAKPDRDVVKCALAAELNSSRSRGSRHRKGHSSRRSSRSGTRKGSSKASKHDDDSSDDSNEGEM